MRHIISAVLALGLSWAAAFGSEGVKVGPLRDATFSSAPAATTAGGSTKIAFAVSAATDVEVAILDAKGNVVRHLAAGVLGYETPPPAPLKPGLSQTIEWDGKDDYGEKAMKGPFKVRVRVGMGSKLEKIVGGDPYAFYSKQSGQGDHFQWKMAGIDAKPDGKVYVMGNTTFYGSQVIRQYDAAGNYIKTVFPPPANKPVDEIKGWGVNVREGGTFTLKNNAGWMGTGLGTTGISTSRYGKIVASFVASPKKDLLAIRLGNSFFSAGTDGTLKACERKPFYGDAKLPPKGQLRGPCYTALSRDGKHLYISGPHSFQRKRSHGRVEKVDTTGFWRDGQVWKMDLATRKMSVFFALDEKKVISGMKTRASAIGDMNYINPAATFHGVAVDAEGRVFVCDRQNKRVVVLDREGKQLGELPVTYPDAIGVSPRSKAVYVTTRYGHYGGNGKLELLKFNDWSTDKSPAAKLHLRDRIGKFPQHSMMSVALHEGEVMIWVAYTTLPVRVYKDTGPGLELVKDFYEAGPQRALDLQHMQVDRKTEHVYIDDAAGWCFRITDWKDPKFQLCIDAATKKKLGAANLAIDSRNRYLYAQAFYGRPAHRYKIDGDRLVSAPAGGSGLDITTGIIFGWGFNGLRPKGMAVCPDGSLVTLGNVRGLDGHRADDYGGYIYYWKRDETKAPWKPTYFKRQSSGGIRFDPRGNMYVSVRGGKFKDLPKGYAREGRYFARIQKFAPTGQLKDGCLYPSAPSAPAKTYDVRCGPIGGGYKTPRFGVDEYGRIYYPNGIEASVGVIDNEGNRILSFGTYGNRDDGLQIAKSGMRSATTEGGKQTEGRSQSAARNPQSAIYMAWPNSVDATDDYIYVTDIINTRLLRLKKTFAATTACAIK